MFAAMLLRNTGGDDACEDSVSPDMQELIDDFVNGIYDTFDTDRSESLEFSEARAAQIDIARAPSQRSGADLVYALRAKPRVRVRLLHGGLPEKL